jgi:hypothetical protein
MPRIFEFHVSGKRLLVGLLVTAVPISLIAILASTRTGRDAESAAGQNLRVITGSIAAIVKERVRAKVIEAALMSSDTAVLDEVLASNKKYERRSDEDIQREIDKIDAAWNTPVGIQMVTRILENPASTALRRKLFTQPAFSRVTVTDIRGATVAATHKTLDYYQADEEYWQDIYMTGRGAVSVTDVLYDDASRTYYIGVGVPITDMQNRVLGTLDALVDISSLFPLLHQPELGPGGHMELVKADGSVITGTREVSLADRIQSQDWAAIRDAQNQFEDRSSGYLRASFPGGRDSLLAFADTGLNDEYRKLDWFVVASQDANALLADSSLTQFIIMAIGLITLAGVVFLAVYFTLHAQSEIDEIEEQMHTVV